MINRTGRKILRWALVSALVLEAAALTAQSGGGEGAGASGGSGRGGHGGQGSGQYGGHGGHSGGRHGGYGRSYGRGYGRYYGGYGRYYGGYGRYYGGIGWYGGYPFYGSYLGYGGYGGYGGPWGYTAVYPAVGATHGALDLDVSPESAQIYVDGVRVGVADDFDGFPDFLWLEKGTYDVVIFAPGFETLARQYSVYGGLVIDIEDSLVRGQETLPEDLVSKSTVNREERLRRDLENEAQVRAYEAADAGRYEEAEADESVASDGAESVPDRLDARGEPGSLKLAIEPADASVYLDGRFLGTGRELARLRSGLIVDPGEHRIEVVRPGREAEEETFSVRAGEEVRLEIELDEN